MYKKSELNNNGSDSAGRGDINHLTFGCPSTSITMQSWLGCHIKRDPSLHWSNEGESSRIWSQAGTRAPSVGVWESLIQEIHKILGPVEVVPTCPTGECSGHSPLWCPSFWQKVHWFGLRLISWSSLQPPWPSRVPSGGLIRAAKSCIFFISFLSLLASFVISLLLQTLKTASTKADSGIWDPVWSFCNCIWMSGLA